MCVRIPVLSTNQRFASLPPARPVLFVVALTPASSSRIRRIRFPGFGSRFDGGSLSQLECAALVEIFDLTCQRRRQQRRAGSQIRHHLCESSWTNLFTSFHKLARALNVFPPIAMFPSHCPSPLAPEPFSLNAALLVPTWIRHLSLLAINAAGAC
jgi:hypothetical protein